MYRLNHQGRRSDSFRDALTSAVMGPFRKLRQLSGTDETQEEFWALRDVSFEVEAGDVVGIIGRNGAGKSTLLKILSRIVEPTQGRTVLRGRVASLLEVGTGFHPELSGRENIYLNGSILGMKKREIDSRFDEIVDFAEVEKFLDTPVKFYSSGMYVRLAFGVAAHLEPEILIVDEVLAVGDSEFQRKCIGKMKEVATGGGRTVLFVSHNMAAIATLCSKACYLKSGKVEFVGDVNSAINIHNQSLIASDKNVAQDVTIAKILKFHFSDSGNQPLRTFQPSTILLHIELKKKLPDVGVHIMISDHIGTLISGFDTRAVNANFGGNQGECFALQFDIASLPLLPGSYEVTIVIRDDINFKAEMVPIPYQIEVIDAPVYGSAKLERIHHGFVGMQIAVSSQPITRPNV